MRLVALACLLINNDFQQLRLALSAILANSLHHPLCVVDFCGHRLVHGARPHDCVVDVVAYNLRL